MKYLSVCAGIEAATVAWHPLGWDPVAFSEIEKFPCAVLAHHYPDVPNYGDMTDHENWPETNVDVLVGGTPYQSFSVAGLRAGMADPRGNLALVYLAIADQFRPRWLVWENVPGVLSSNDGRDFGAIIGGMVELGYSPTWRVLDAQYFGVPQRRRRVFVVASSRDWRDSAEVLLEPESLQRNSAPSRETGERIADSLTVGANQYSGFCGEPVEHIPEVANPLTARMHKGINTTLDEGQTAIPWSFNWQNGGGYGNANEGLGIDEDRAGPCSRSQVQAVAVMENQRAELRLSEQTDALSVGGGKPGQGYPAALTACETVDTLSVEANQTTGFIGDIAAQNMAVRRLTPLECERLQGFPDNYTNIPGASDSARYKALGNSMAVPVMHWIGKRIDEYEKKLSS